MMPAMPVRRSGAPGTTVTSRSRNSTRVGPGSRIDAKTRAWQVSWTPFWIGSDSPAPDFPVREIGAPLHPAPAVRVFLDELDRIRRVLWARQLTSAVVRGVWLGLAVVCVVLALDLLRPGTSSEPSRLALVVVGAALLGLVFGLLTGPNRRRTARMLDRTFVLRERMSTAVEFLTTMGPADGVRASVPYLQLADAANVVSVLRKQNDLRFRLPTRELLLVCFWGLILAILLFLRGVGGAPPTLAAGSVPHFTPVASRHSQTNQPAAIPPQSDQATVEEIQAQTDRSNQARQDLQSLANALADHGVTSDAAAEITAGDYAKAAEDLRQAATGAPEWSAAGRNALASDLQGAADEMTPGETGLQQATTDAAEGLEQGDQPAEDAMHGLADAVERTGDQVASNEELANQMQAAQERRAAAGGAAGDAQPAAGASANQEGSQQDPGAGSDAGAEPGANDSGSQSRQGANSGEQTGNQGGEGPPGGQPGDSGQPGSANQPGQGGDRGVNQGGGQMDGDSPRASTGGGAGGGEAEDLKTGDTGASSGKTGVQEPKNVEVQQRVTNSDGARGALSPLAETGETLSLPQEASGPGVQTINDGGSAMLGSGTGITAGNGTEVQGAMSEAGPDSNHVPGEYRDVVERYFSDGEGP